MGRTPLSSNCDPVSTQISVEEYIDAPRGGSEYGGTGKGAPRDNQRFYGGSRDKIFRRGKYWKPLLIRHQHPLLFAASLSIAPTLARKWSARNFSANCGTLQNSSFITTPYGAVRLRVVQLSSRSSAHRIHFMATKIQIRNSTDKALVEAYKKQVFSFHRPI
jgi:hypothetical protein